jgi:hypothetical protein
MNQHSLNSRGAANAGFIETISQQSNVGAFNGNGP